MEPFSLALVIVASYHVPIAYAVANTIQPIITFALSVYRLCAIRGDGGCGHGGVDRNDGVHGTPLDRHAWPLELLRKRRVPVRSYGLGYHVHIICRSRMVTGISSVCAVAINVGL